MSSHSAVSAYQDSLRDALETFRALAGLDQEIHALADLITRSLVSGRKLLFCGNGGSAADAGHIASEFTCRFKEDRRPYPALALAADGGLLTAIGNDYVFEQIFARQVRAYGQEGDVLIALSTSGKSRNILAALEAAKAAGVISVALLGRDGGFSRDAADITIFTPGTVTARIQEAQKFLLHVLCELVESDLPRH